MRRRFGRPRIIQRSPHLLRLRLLTFSVRQFPPALVSSATQLILPLLVLSELPLPPFVFSEPLQFLPVLVFSELLLLPFVFSEPQIMLALDLFFRQL